jgi:GMP synthase (glutamine-hydrolysing)
MRIHYLQHVPFEGLGNIENWALSKGHQIADTQLYNNDPLPEPEEFDWLIVMGGPMNIYEEDRFPWLAREKVFIKDAIDSGKIVLGVCLGAQLIADALGAKIHKNQYPEIGWFDVRLTDAARKSRVFRRLPERFTAFHWHGDTFDLPPGATRIAESESMFRAGMSCWCNAGILMICAGTARCCSMGLRLNMGVSEDGCYPDRPPDAPTVMGQRQRLGIQRA